MDRKTLQQILSFAFIISAVFATDYNNSNSSDLDLIELEPTDLDTTTIKPTHEESVDATPITSSNTYKINFNSLISSESPQNILLASNKLSFQSESSQIKWLEDKQKEAINGDPHPVVVCDVDSSRTSGQRKALLLGIGFKEKSVLTVYNSEEKSCYIVHSRDEELSRFSANTYTILPLSYVWKMRSKTVETISKTDRSGPLLINTLLFQQNKVKTLSSTSEVPSYAKKVLSFTEKEVLNGNLFFANQPGSKSMSFFGYDNGPKENNGNESTPNTDDITSICKKSYNHLKFSYSDFMGEKDLLKMAIDTAAMEEFITKTYQHDTPSLNMPPDEIFQNCVLSIVTSMSLLPEVFSVEILPEVNVANDQLQYLVQSFTDKEYPWYDVGLTGEDEVVALSDSGIDINNCYFWDNSGSQAPYGSNNIDLSQRKIVQYDDFADNDDTQFGHGTHTSGTLSGHRAINGIMESRGVADGVAFNSKIAFIDCESPATGFIVPPADRLLNTGRPYAKIHSASWGFLNGQYITISSEVDHYTYYNDDFLFVVAAGNEGTNNAFQSLRSPCDAKNTICVGASNSYGPDSTSIMASPSYVSGFSSKGPTYDGRIKPDIIAPGLYVMSAGAQPDVTGECDPADGIYPRAEYIGKDGLMSMFGTSMATPAISGVLAMMRQYFKMGFYPTGEECAPDSMDPSNALLKAVLLNGGQQLHAVDNPGYERSDQFTTQIYFPSVPYDSIQGFGLVSLVDSLYIKDKTNMKAIVHDRQSIKEGEAKCISVSIDHSSWCQSKTFSVTLVWMDKASMPGCTGKCLINDLDLYVTKNHDENYIFYPNGRSVRDDQNTVERVRIQGVEHDDVYSIYVRGTVFDIFDEVQHYALAVTGCVHENDEASSHSEGSHSHSGYSSKGKKGRSERTLKASKGGRRRKR